MWRSTSIAMAHSDTKISESRAGQVSKGFVSPDGSYTPVCRHEETTESFKEGDYIAKCEPWGEGF
jgi:hypothetical protein